MKRFFLLCFFLWTQCSATALHTYGTLTVSKIVDVHDGDTFKCDIDDVHPIIGHAVPVRIAGIDTPEIHSKQPDIKALAYKARDYAAMRLMEAKIIKLVNIQRDKYFRLLADVYVDGANLGDELLQSGLAHPYNGKTKPLWEENR